MTASPLLWPALALVALLAVNVVLTPSFLSIRVQDGHLFGSLIDILRNGAPTMLVALGMTLVIASRGIDLSVGAVVAVSGALACAHIAASADPASAGTVVTAMGIALGVAVGLGLWNGMLVSVFGVQPIIATLVLMTAGRGIALLITDGQIVTVTSAPFKVLGAGYAFGLPVAILVSLSVFASGRPADPTHRPGHAAGIGRHQPGGQQAGRRALPLHRVRGLRLLRTVRRSRRPDDRVEHLGGRRQQRRTVDRDGRHPGGGDRWHLAARRTIQPDRNDPRRA